MSEQFCQCRLAPDEIYFGGFHQRVTTAAYWFTRYLREWQEEHGRAPLSEEMRANFNERAARMEGTRVVIGRCPDYRRECERRVHERKLEEMRSESQREDAF